MFELLKIIRLQLYRGIRKFKFVAKTRYSNIVIFNACYSGRQIYQYNDEDFRFQFWFFIKLLNSMDSHKHRSQEKLSIKKLLFDYL